MIPGRHQMTLHPIATSLLPIIGEETNTASVHKSTNTLLLLLLLFVLQMAERERKGEGS